MVDLIPSMTPQEHFQREVLPNYRDFLADPSSEYKMKNAVTAIQYWVEWTYRYFQHHDPSQVYGIKEPELFCRAISNDGCKDLWTVWDLALNRKHRFLDRRLDTRIAISSTGSVSDMNGVLVHNSFNEPMVPIVMNSVEFLKSRFGVSE
ncbi:MAG: hypothetical protein Q8K85_19610 [Hyphomicrobium sp.]|nr:hypothetical protein [Hyphomicrobium sp.]